MLSMVGRDNVGELPIFSHGRRPLNDSFASAASADSFYSCFGEELETGLKTNNVSLDRSRSGERGPGSLPKMPRQNNNLVSDYRWLEEVLQEIAVDAPRSAVSDMDNQQVGTPLFVVAGACPNQFCGTMQAILYNQMGPRIAFWWIKPQNGNSRRLERNTRNKHSTGPFKNVPGDKSGRLYSLFAEKFSGAVVGTFRFGVDESGYAFIEEHRKDGVVMKMFVYLVWQEAWSSMLSRSRFMQGKICYTKRPLAVSSVKIAEPQFFNRQYRLQADQIMIAPLEDEETVATVLPPVSFQEMYDMGA